MRSILIFFMSITTICCAMEPQSQTRTWGEWAWGLLGFETQEQKEEQLKRRAWAAASSVHEVPQETWWYHATIQPHKQALEAARDILGKEGAGISLRTTYEGLSNVKKKQQLHAGNVLAATDENTVYFSPKALRYLSCQNPRDQAIGEWIVRHEQAHMANKHNLRFHHIRDMNLNDDAMANAWHDNVVRRNEFEADQKVARDMATDRLLAMAAVFEHSRSTETHPGAEDRVRIIEEELRARETGARLPEDQSEAAQKYFARNKSISTD